MSWLIIGTGVFLMLGVVVSRQFPGLTSGPKTSAELLETLFSAPVEIPKSAAAYAIGRIKKDAVIAFIQLCDAPADVKARVTQLVTGEHFDDVASPFMFYLYDLYAAPARASEDATNDLAYAEHAPVAAGGGRLRVGALLRHPAAVRKHAGNALRLFDALFLRTKSGAAMNAPLRDRYDPAAYDQVKSVVRELAGEFLGPSDASKDAQSEYVAMFDQLLRDDERLSEFVEFFTDLTRTVTDSWLQSFVTREKRKEARVAWVEERIRENRYYEISDYARRQAERKLAIHLVVDGLQGKLLEGLAELSSGHRDAGAARYVIDLVRAHQTPAVKPSGRDTALPAALGHDIVELADRAPDRPAYLESFKRYFFGADATAVVVNVATVDTPSISVRNLPIAYSGHGVAGPYGTGIPNFSYLDRSTGRGWYFWGSDMLYLRDIFANREDLVPHGRRREGSGARTLMERLWRKNTVSAMATIDTGALEKISSEASLATGELWRNFMEKVLIQKFRARAAMERELNTRRRWLMDHRRTSDSLLASLVTKTVTLATFREYARFVAEHEDEGLPDYLLWYNPWPDHFAHGKGPYSDAIVGYEGEYDRLDFYIGKLIEVYESVPTITGSGATYADRALFGLVSDHGLVYTPRLMSSDERLFDAMRRDGIRITYQKITHDEGGLPAIHGREYMKPTRGFDAVVGSTAGGSYVIDLFGGGAPDGTDADWAQHPDYQALRQYRLASGQTVDWIDQLKTRLADSLDVAVVREQSTPNAGIAKAVRIVTPNRGEARVVQFVGSGSDPAGQDERLGYQILGDRDPLDLVGSVREFLIPPGGPSVEHIRNSLTRCIASQGGCDDREWQQWLSYTLRPDVIHQFLHLYDSDRAGTINVFPLDHVGMNSGVVGRHAGEGFGEKNGTQLYRGAGLKRATLQTARHGSLAVTIYHWLSGDDIFSQSNGVSDGAPAVQFGYRSLLGEPAFAPIR